MSLCFSTPCISLLFPCLWFLPSLFLSGTCAATAIATISMIGNVGRIFAQSAIPLSAQMVGTAVAAMLVPSICLTGVGILAIYMRVRGFGGKPNILRVLRKSGHETYDIYYVLHGAVLVFRSVPAIASIEPHPNRPQIGNPGLVVLAGPCCHHRSQRAG
jgi:hypothetical protein